MPPQLIPSPYMPSAGLSGSNAFGASQEKPTLDSIFSGGTKTSGLSSSVAPATKSTLDSIFSNKTPNSSDSSAKLDSIFKGGVKSQTQENQPQQKSGLDYMSDSFSARRTNIQQTSNDYANGKIGLGQAFLNNVGQVVGGAFDIPVDVAKAALNDPKFGSAEPSADSPQAKITDWLANEFSKPENATMENAANMYQHAGDLYHQAHLSQDPNAKSRILSLADQTKQTADLIKEKANEIDTNYKENALTGESAVNIGSMALGAGGSADDLAVKAGKGVTDTLKEMGPNDAPPSGPSVETKIPALNESSVIDKYNRAIKPSVAGKANASQIAQSNSRVVSGLKAIADNKETLSFTDSEGNSIAGQSPKSVDQLSQAIDQTKKTIYSKYDSLAAQAGEKGITVDSGDVAKELDPVINSKSLAIANPKAVAYAKELQTRLNANGEIDADTTQEVIQHYNNSLKAYYRNPSYDTANTATIDAMVANKFRSLLDKGITGVTGEQYQALKSQYGALSSMEKDVARRNVVWGRQNGVGLTAGLSNIASGAELVRGLLTHNPVDMAIGGTIKGIELYNKYLNNPDVGISKIFDELDRSSSAPRNGTKPESQTKSPVQPQGKDGTSIDITTEKNSGQTIAEKNNGKIPTQGGMVKNPFSTLFNKMSSAERGTISDFTDLHGKGGYKPDNATAHQLEIDASEIAEKYGITGFKTAKGLANHFGKILEAGDYKAGDYKTGKK